MVKTTEEFRTTEEVMRLFHIGRSTLYRWVREGRIPRVKLGRRNLFAESDIKRLIREMLKEKQKEAKK